MKLKIYQVDAFTDKTFSGNPAAVCPLDEWISDELLQKIAMENNLAETAFYVMNGNEYELRWFTPTTEVALCGHATLAAAFVLFNYEDHSENKIVFNSRQSGQLIVTKDGEFLTLNFPADTLEELEISNELTDCFDIKPAKAFKGITDYMLVFENKNQIKNLQPNLTEILKLDCRGVIITAKGNTVDFVSRFFAPKVGISEDPVTGSAHTTLIPYWAGVYKKNKMTAIQLSKRTGFLKCKYLKERVEISGQAKLFLIGEVFTE